MQRVFLVSLKYYKAVLTLQMSKIKNIRIRRHQTTGNITKVNLYEMQKDKLLCNSCN